MAVETATAERTKSIVSNALPVICERNFTSRINKNGTAAEKNKDLSPESHFERYIDRNLFQKKVKKPKEESRNNGLIKASRPVN